MCEENELLALESSPSGRSNERVPSGRSNERVPSGRSYGFAVDLGTTTVDLALLDLESGKRLARRAFLNGQVSFGADVISRAQSFHDERIPVREAALRTIDVGADTIGMIVALDLEAERTTTLSIDIGTNGEMVLARTGKLLATSTAAGPAFEGAQISCGMRALDGAIRDVAISGDGRLRLQVVGGGGHAP